MFVDLWTARLKRHLTDWEAKQLTAQLPAERRERMGKQREEKRTEVLCAYALLRLALWERYGWRSWPAMAVGEQGKPWFSSHPEIHFNISHTHGAVLVGLADRPVGVDIERIRPMRERAMMEVAQTSSETEFFRVWVRREARAKRDGISVAGMLRQEPELAPGEYYRELNLFPGYLAGVSVCEAVPEIQVRTCSVEELLTSSGSESNKISDKEKERC